MIRIATYLRIHRETALRYHKYQKLFPSSPAVICQILFSLISVLYPYIWKSPPDIFSKGTDVNTLSGNITDCHDLIGIQLHSTESEPLRSSQIIPEHKVYPFSPTIRFSIVALSSALISRLYS